MSLGKRRQLVDRNHRLLPITRQCALLGVSRSGLYYRSRGTSEEDLALMQAMGPAVPGDPLLLVETHEGLAGAAGDTGEPEAGAAADAHHGAAGHLPGSPHQPAGAGASGLSLSAGKGQDHPTQPELAPA